MKIVRLAKHGIKLSYDRNRICGLPLLYTHILLFQNFIRSESAAKGRESTRSPPLLLYLSFDTTQKNSASVLTEYNQLGTARR